MPPSVACPQQKWQGLGFTDLGRNGRMPRCFPVKNGNFALRRAAQSDHERHLANLVMTKLGRALAIRVVRLCLPACRIVLLKADRGWFLCPSCIS
ncbi:hypothetical protein [Sporisorium scitamineum]|uniref:Uncharacterized protein n=1 Tax=Sporisorium scitamineum TaxID=49012 RepID=A0A0F7S2Y0_9BASI|nr:hypothetical protein [Sporisorium scitamineum]